VAGCYRRAVEQLREEKAIMEFHHHAAAVTGRPWSKAEDKVFESALVLWPDHTPDRWAMVAAQLPGRTPREAWEHYEALVADVDLIERGAVDVPGSWDDDDEESSTPGRRAGSGRARGETRRPGIPWSEEEHRYVASSSILSF
jgi:hypothetical protein